MQEKTFKVITTIVLLFVLTGSMMGQQKADFRQVDSLTYQYYLDKNWKPVLKTGKQAIKNDIDYYYLRMRMGIAAFEEGKPAIAANHFKKALKFNQNDPVAQGYLYDSHLEMGKTNRAWKLAGKFNPALRSSLTTKMKTVESVDLMGGYIFSNNYEKNNDLYLMGSDSLFGKQRMYGNEQYLHAGIKFNFSPTVSMYASFNNINIQTRSNFEYISYKEGTITIDTSWGYIRYPDTIPDTSRQSFSNPMKQNEVYLNMRLQFNKGWALTLYSNILFVNVNKTKANYEAITVTDTAYYVDATGDYELFDYITDSYTFTNVDSSFVNWVAGFNLEKDINTVTFSLTGSFSQINKGNQLQGGVSALYYPFGNTRFYGYTGFLFFNNFYSEEGGNNNNGNKPDNERRHGNGNNNNPGRYNAESRVVFSQKLGVQLFKSGWLEGEVYYGNLNALNLNDGFIVFNQPDKINLSLGLTFTVLITRHLELGIYYRYMDKSGNYFTFDKEHTRYQNFSFNYQTQNLIGGIKWRF
ncbi:MAG: tetratricopeptide repeat protein [Chlorobi bacterium]|nr:tetratricopeptide repeat protein [Chlorobiota bacterium]